MKRKFISKYIIVTSFLMLYLVVLQSQNYLVNTGCVVSIPQGIKLHLNGSLINQNTGYFINEDSIFITGDINQSASNNLFQNNGQGTVLLIGGNQQIGGSSVPYFNNLLLQGTGIKSLAVDVRIKGSLNIDDKEFATENYTLYVDNTDTNAIIRTSGIISSDISGFIQRAMAHKGNYLFPTGWSNITKNYRPIIINVPNANADTFKISLLGYSATNDGFDLNNKDSTLCKVNNYFYHHIDRLSTNISQVQLKIYFDTLMDGMYDRIAHWQGNNPQWQNTSNPSSLNYYASPLLSEISIIKWNNFNPTPFALALSNPDPNINLVNSVCENSSSFNLTANIQGGNWHGTGITDPVNGTFDPQVSGPGTFTVYYDISNSYGCIATDSSTIVVEVPALAVFNTSVSVGDVNFTNNSVNASNYYWDFGDGNFSSDASPNHTYLTNGSYTVILYASNSCNNDSTFQIINITNVGIEENNLNNIVSVYPNPIQNNSVISLSINNASVLSIDLFSVTGEKINSIIKEKNLQAGKYIFNLDANIFNYVAGVYILHIKLNDFISVKRIIYI